MYARAALAEGIALAVGLLATTPAGAVIARPTPLQGVLEATPVIFMARVESLDSSRPAMTLVAGEALKGKVSLARVPVTLRGDTTARRAGQVPQLLKRLAPGLPLVVFVSSQRDRSCTAFAYTNGTWFQMTGTQTADGPRWSLTHCEPCLRSTFKGPTADLRQVIIDVLAGKARAPALDLKEKPGLGPEVEKPAQEHRKPEAGPAPDEPGRRASLPGGPVFAIIPSILVGGPLALLAMLFPVLFGGLALVMRRWLAVLSVLSLNSTLYLVHRWLVPSSVGLWWTTPVALWLAMTAITLAGLLWAWRRHLNPKELQAPRRWELLVLTAGSIACLAVVALRLPHAPAQLAVGGKAVWAMAGGLWLATLHAGYLRFVAARRPDARPGLPGEGVFLWAMLGVGVGLAVTFREDAPAGAVVEESGGPVRVVWRFRPPAERCWFASSPLVHGERVYIGAIMPNVFRPGGALYCLDRATGTLVWSFNDHGHIKDVFSSPCVAGGRLYVGEGLHQHQGCKLYCLDVAAGTKRWAFTTASHTESSPCVVDGRVCFGAGDDGLYCLDAADATVRWHLQGLHVDANPLVAGRRVYGGSGAGDIYKETAVFCLDAVTGQELWRVPTELPVWAMPALQDGRLYVGLGNGNFVDSAAEPGGAVLCVAADSGKRLWRCDARDGVLGRVAADAAGVYFASRDGYCYCADARDGVVRWKTHLGGPIVASPALGAGPRGTEAVYVISSGGRLVRLHPATGQGVWSFDVAADAGQDAQTFSSPAVVPAGEHGRRRIFFGCGLDGFTHGLVYCVEDRAGDHGP
jgi:outer membrane protein assembly factor BamB